MKNDGGPALPVPESLDGEWADPQTCKQFVPYRGMSLRDWLAGQALTGMLTRELDKDGGGWANVERVAQDAYKLADAMLKERSRE